MSLITARKRRTTLHLSIAGLMVMVAAVSAISGRDPDGVMLRVGMIMVTVGAALTLGWRQLIPAVLVTWLAPNLGRGLIDDVPLFNLNMLLELPGLAGVAFFTTMTREALQQLEQENVLIGAGGSAGRNPETGIFDGNQLRSHLESELARSRRFGRTFSLVLVGIDEMRQKFDYRDDAVWRASMDATAHLLRQTRNNVDRVFHYRGDGFAIILPESTEKDIPGLVKRLRQMARSMEPAEGEAGGPMPVHFGATFFPECATTVDDLLRRAEVALKIASSSTTRYQLDSAEAPELPPAESLRRDPETVEPANSVPTSPAALNNPVAVAIVGEASAEPTRQEVAQDELEQAPEPIIAAEDLEEQPQPALAAEEHPMLQQEPASSDAVLEPVFAADAEAKDAPIEIQPSADEDVPATKSEPEPAFVPSYGAYLVASNGSPAVEAASAARTREPEVTAVAIGSGNVDDDFEALLKQMDETLKMIKSVRSSAA